MNDPAIATKAAVEPAIRLEPTAGTRRSVRRGERVRLAEALGFAAIWLRDVPFDVPSFGDAGQTLDPFVDFGYLAARTERIALGVASLILPLRHPAHVAEAAASADVLSGGRLLLGVASGDRPEEYPTLGIPFDGRGAPYLLTRRLLPLDFDNDARRFGSPHPDASDPTKGKAVIRRLDSIIATASA